MCQSMVNIQSPTAEIRRGKKRRRRKKQHENIYLVSLLHRATIKQDENTIMVCPIPQGDHNYTYQKYTQQQQEQEKCYKQQNNDELTEEHSMRLKTIPLSSLQAQCTDKGVPGCSDVIFSLTSDCRILVVVTFELTIRPLYVLHNGSFRRSTPNGNELRNAVLTIVKNCRHLPHLYSNETSRVPHISDTHSKFALRPHHVWKYGRDPISGR